MKAKWNHRGRAPRERASAELKRRALGMSLWPRIDPVLVAGVVFALLVLFLFCFGAIEGARRIGWLDPPLVRPIADDRILENVRRDLADAPLLDAVMHKPDGHVYLSREDGAVHRYHPPTRLWSTERPFTKKDSIHPPFTMLRSGCGTDPLSSRVDQCPDPGSLWAVSGEGGLARRFKGRWEVILGDTVFNGADGKPVDDDELTAAAVSEDNRWLAVGSRENGVGLYNIPRRLWISIGEDVFRRFPSPNITHVVWWKDRFWVGGPKGMISFGMAGDAPEPFKTPRLGGEVVDLDADPRHGLLALLRVECTEGGEECQRVARIRDPLGTAEILIDEQNRYPDLKLADLNYARYHDNRLTLAGDAGVFSYDAGTHAWKRLLGEAVAAALPMRRGPGFYIGFKNGVGAATSEAVVTWPVPNENFIKLRHANGADVYALSDAGNLFGFSDSKKPTAIFKGASTSFDPTRFTAAFSIDDVTVFLSPEGALLHNISTREYTDVQKNALPGWLRNPRARLIHSGAHVYGLSPFGKKTTVVTMTAANAGKGDFSAIFDPAFTPEPIRRARNWGEGGVSLIAGDDAVYLFNQYGRSALTGPAAPEMNRLELLDAASREKAFIVSTRKGIRTYRLGERRWSDFIPPPADAAALELDVLKDRLLARTNKNRLVQFSGGNPVLIGDKEGFGISDGGLDDAVSANQGLYLAGEGRIERYDPRLRRITNRWDPPGRETVALKGFVGTTPLATTAGRAVVGKRVVDPDAGNVVNLSVDEKTIWTVRTDGVHRHLRGHPIAAWQNRDAADCYFRNPTPGPKATRVSDALALTGGVVAVAADDGLHFYDPTARSWFDGPAFPGGAGGRVYDMNGFLVHTAERPDGWRLSIAPMDSIQIPHGCADEPAALDKKTYKFPALAVDAAGGRAAYIREDGYIGEWRDGAWYAILPPPGPNPDPAAIRRVYERHRNGEDDLWFTTDGDLRRYNLNTHAWSRVSLKFDASASTLADMDLVAEGDREIVIARTAGGDIHMGAFRFTDSEAPMSRIFSSPESTLGADPGRLLDVQEGGEHPWTFVLDDRIKYYDPETGQWLPDAEFPFVDPTLTHGRVGGRSVATADDGASWWVARDVGPAPTRFVRWVPAPRTRTAVDSEGSIWTLSSNGILWKYPVPESGGYNEYLPARPPPFLIEPSRVLRTHRWENFLLFETREGLRLLDAVRDREIPLPDFAARFTGVENARASGTRLFLQGEDRLLLLEHDYSGGVAAKMIPGARELIFDETGAPWARFSRGWAVWEADRFVSPPVSRDSRAALAGMTLFVVEGSAVTGLDGFNHPHRWGAALISDESPLPDAIDVNAVHALIPGEENDWWVVTPERVFHVVRAWCESGSEPPGQRPEGETDEEDPDAEEDPCLVVGGRVEAPRRVAPLDAYPIHSAAALDESSLEIVFANGRALVVEKEVDGGYTAKTTRDQPLPKAGIIADDWPSRRGRMVQFDNGKWAYDPIVSLRTTPTGELRAITPSRAVFLAARGAVQPEPAPALDAGWLRWDRAGKRFDVQTNVGRRYLKPREFIIDKQLIFERIDAVLARSTGELYAANEHGVWFHGGDGVNFDDPAIIYTPMSLRKPISAAHGRFMTGDGDVLPPENGRESGKRRHGIRFGAVEITEDMRPRRIQTRVDIGVGQVPALTRKGFIWDVNRRAIGFGGAGLAIQSDAGVHPPAAFSGFDPGPNRVAARAGRLQSEGRRLLFFHDGAWWERDQRGWTSLKKDPLANRSLFKNSTWEWTLEEGRLRVSLNGAPHGFGWIRTPGGFAFTSDLLKDAAVHGGKLHVMTEAFFEIAQKPRDLASLNAARHPPLPADSLEEIRFSDGRRDLFRRHKGVVHRWNSSPGKNRFTRIRPGEDDPYRERLLVDTGRLRITAHPDSVTKELKVAHPTSGDHRVPFDFVDGQFPFDVVTSLAVRGEELLIGSAAGLQTYPPGLSTGLDDILEIYDMRTGSTGPLVAVSKVGFPESQPDLLIASADKGACIERFRGGPFKASGKANLLQNRWRVRTDFWQWIEKRRVGVVGRYVESRGGFSLDAVRMTAGRFPHDHVEDAAVRDGRAFTMWRGGWITVHEEEALRIAPGVRNFDMEDSAPRRFIPVERDYLMGGIAIPPGMYFEGRDNRIWTFSESLWKETPPELARRVLEYGSRPPVIHRKNLRLLPPGPGKTFQFEHRTMHDLWLPLAWQSGRVALDWPRDVLLADNRLWAATPGGVCNFSLRPDGRAYLDPDAVIVIREPRDRKGMLEITDLAEENGVVLARCDEDSAKVFSGTLDGERDAGVFQPWMGPDPFAEKVLIREKETGFWEWRMIGRRDGRPGHLAGSTRGEAMHLVAGRLPFDGLTSLTFFHEDLLEMASETGGWRQAGADADLHVRHLKRPRLPAIEPAPVTRVHVTRAGGKKRLCARGSEGKLFRLSESGAAELVEACPEYMGEGPLWRYMKTDSSLSITAVDSIGGVGKRRLISGRFTDDTVTGLPVAGEDDHGRFHLLPTRAGVLHLSPGFQSAAIHAPPFPGLPKGVSPRVLYMLAPRLPVYAGQDAFRRLDDSREPAVELKLVSLDEAPLYAMEDGPRDSIRVRRRNEGDTGWASIEAWNRRATENRLRIDLSGLDKFAERRMAWNNPTPMMELFFRPGEITASNAEPRRPVAIELPENLDLLTPILVEDRLLLIGKRELLEVSLETAMAQTFNAPVSTPPRAEPPPSPKPEPKAESRPESRQAPESRPGPGPKQAPEQAPPTARAPLDSDGDGVIDRSDICLGTPDGVETDPYGCILLEDIRFPTGKIYVQRRYHPLLDGVVDALNKNPGLTFRIHGHTDRSGSEEENIRLSRRRAEAVASYLLNKGIQKERLKVKGLGSSSPKYSNDTEDGRTQNRRVELRFAR